MYNEDAGQPHEKVTRHNSRTPDQKKSLLFGVSSFCFSIHVIPMAIILLTNFFYSAIKQLFKRLPRFSIHFFLIKERISKHYLVYCKTFSFRKTTCINEFFKINVSTYNRLGEKEHTGTSIHVNTSSGRRLYRIESRIDLASVLNQGRNNSGFTQRNIIPFSLTSSLVTSFKLN